jgi:DNA-binding SARP family transcriptional activator
MDDRARDAKQRGAQPPALRGAPAESNSRETALEEIATAVGDRSARSLADHVFNGLPYGVVLVDRAGTVRSANPAALRLSWDAEHGGPPGRCEEVFGCRVPGGPCEQGCLVRRAIESRQALPEIRIDSRTGCPVSAVWTTVAPLPECDGALLHLRPGDARDRRRRSLPHWLDGPQLRIQSLGRTQLETNEGPLAGEWLHQRPGQILKYLVCERNRVVHAEEIAEALWPEGRYGALNNVRHFIHALRDRLEPGRPKRAASSFVVTVRGGYAINRRRVMIDVDEFEDLAKEGLMSARMRTSDAARDRLERAILLYRGDLMVEEHFSDWVVAERDRLRELAAQALRTLTDLALDAADLRAASRHLTRLTELDPLDIGAQRRLLTVWLAEGRRSDAFRRFAALRRRLVHELGEEPDFGLRDLRPKDLLLPREPGEADGEIVA